jgi:TPR repeat protein
MNIMPSLRAAVQADAKTVGHDQEPTLYFDANGDFFFGSMPDSTTAAAVAQPPIHPTDDNKAKVVLADLSKLPVAAVQYALIGVGVLSGDPDGIAGPNTEKAIRAWQTKIGAAATGALTPEENIALVQEAAASKNQPESQNTYGIMLAIGLGVQEDPSQAASMFSRAAAKSAEAKTNLSLLSESARGIGNSEKPSRSFKFSPKRATIRAAPKVQLRSPQPGFLDDKEHPCGSACDLSPS